MTALDVASASDKGDSALVFEVLSKHLQESAIAAQRQTSQVLNLVKGSAKRLSEVFSQLNKRLKSVDKKSHLLGVTGQERDKGSRSKTHTRDCS